MRCLNRNKTKLYYATYVSKSETLDEYGNPSGSYAVVYSNPIELRANVSAARGTSDIEMFGVSLNYDKAVMVDDMGIPITETSVLWVDEMPTIAANGTTATKHDYIVKRVAKSINSIAFAIQKVDVS